MNVNGIEFQTRPTGTRPLLGLTVLLIEDSRYSSEAVRLMCLRSGARIRRADCVASARRHLNVYRPTAAIVDIGLPDGSGVDLIAAMNAARPRVPILLGTSGSEREEAARDCLKAGADGFMAKPIRTLAAFQSAILEHLPEALRPQGPREAHVTEISPDPVALREDLVHAMDLLSLDAPPVGYLRRFLVGLARTTSDTLLERSALGMEAGFAAGDRSDMRELLTRRMEALPAPI